MNSIQYSDCNQYLIKSLLNNQYFTFDKKKDQLIFSQINSLQCDKEYYWTITSLDQEKCFISNYSLRFGEFIKISPNKSQYQNQIISKQFLLIQQPDTNIISSQSFRQFKDNLVNKQPCVFLNSENNFYLTINKEYFTFQEQPNAGSYFQIIPFQEKALEPIRPILKFHYEFEIRNYLTGYSLDVVNQPSNLSVTAKRKSKNIEKIEKWSLENEFENRFQIFNLHYQKSINTKDRIVNLVDKNPTTECWVILTMDQKDITYGVPFLIQNSITKEFLTMNIVNLKEPKNNQQEVLQSSILMPNSLWIIFNHSI